MKLIFTADDYGVFDEIDDAVIEAVKAGRINSVAILPNGPNLKRRIEKLKRAIPRGQGVDLGCHLTFCSGKPLAASKPLKNFVDGKYFRPFGKLKRASERNREEEIDYLQTEIRAQIRALQEAGVEDIKHFTCHHNTLMWFEDYFLAFLEVVASTDGGNIPIRSPFFLPDSLFETYRKIAVPIKNKFFFFRGNNTYDNYRRWQKNFGERVPHYLQSYGTQTIDGTYTNHYGPAGGARLENHEIDFQVAKRKHPVLTEISAKNRDGTYEVVFHLIRDDYTKRNKFRKKLKAHKRKRGVDSYPGISPGYVDGRMAEMRSLMSYDVYEIPFTSWTKPN